MDLSNIINGQLNKIKTRSAVDANAQLHVSLGGNSTSPKRLQVQGAQVMDMSNGTAVPIRLVGFNWQLGRVGSNPDEGKYMQQVVPGTNVARIVGVLWDNESGSKDCMDDRPEAKDSGYFHQECWEELDKTVKMATSAGVWAIVTVRAQKAAGQYFDTQPGTDVFHNDTLKTMYVEMVKTVAQHYSTWDYIGAIEIMSEPRDKEVDPKVLHDFYEEGCKAVRSVDKLTPCMVGPRNYYKMWRFPEVTPLSDTNVIYTVDYFEPIDYIFGKGASSTSKMTTYPGSYQCKDLYKGWADLVCKQNMQVPDDTLLTFDKAWTTANLKNYVDAPVRAKYKVPVFMNQWGVVHGLNADNDANGRYKYMSDTAEVMKELDIGWSWWTWRGGNSEGWSHGSMEFVFAWPNGTMMVDQGAVDAVVPWM